MDAKEYKKVLDAAVRAAHENHNYITEKCFSDFFKPLELTEEQERLTREYFTGLNIKFGEWDGNDEDDAVLEDTDGNYLSFYLEEISGLPKFSEDEKKEIFRSAMEDDDDDAKKKIINMHLGDVVDIARLYVYHGMPLEDLIGEGNIGLMMAVDLLGTIETIDEIEGLIGKTIMDAMDAAIARDSEDKTGIEDVLEKLENISKAAKELSEDLRRDVSSEELARESGISIEDIEEAIRLTSGKIEGLVK